MVKTLADIRRAVDESGLAWRGALRLDESEQVGRLAGLFTVALIGVIGPWNWTPFASAPEYGDGEPHPLDRWSRRVIGELAGETGGTPLFPFDGPPYLPFQAWGYRAEPMFASPLGLAIHSEYGLWHSYRGALGFAQDFEAPAVEAGENPCATCAARPCLSACPVGAFTGAGYDVGICAGLLRREPAGACMSGGCLARRVCPVGRENAYAPTQARFHMEAFVNSLPSRGLSA